MVDRILIDLLTLLVHSCRVDFVFAKGWFPVGVLCSLWGVDFFLIWVVHGCVLVS